jgi:hypothetical protein
MTSPARTLPPNGPTPVQVPPTNAQRSAFQQQIAELPDPEPRPTEPDPHHASDADALAAILADARAALPSLGFVGLREIVRVHVDRCARQSDGDLVLHAYRAAGKRTHGVRGILADMARTLDNLGGE